ncbi:MAG: glycosyltransferase family 4 protein [bacterium]|nr:glycosyltransferase family 4 protein [bacterium]
MASRRILLVTPFGFTGRLANFVEAVSARLLSASGWQVSGLTRFEVRQNDDARVEGGISVHRYRSTAGALLQLLYIVLRERPAIVHVHMLRNNRVGIAAAILAKLMRKKLLFTEHGLLHDPYLTDDREDPLRAPLHEDGIVRSVREIFARARGMQNAVSLLKNFFYHWGLTHADELVFVSEHNVALAKRLGFSRVSYLPYLIDSFRWDRGAPVLGDVSASRAALPDGVRAGTYALFVGQIKKRKGWDIALATIARIDPSIIPCLVVVSSTSAEAPEQFTEILDALGISSRVLYKGKVSDTALSALYQGARVVLIPSRYEGFGLPAIEALAFERPIVASDVPELNVFLKHEKNALLVRPADPDQCASAIARIVSDSGLDERLVHGGRATLAAMRDKRIASEWRAFYESQIS